MGSGAEMVALVLALTGIASGAWTVTDRSEIAIADRSIRVADVVNNAGSAKMARREVARIPLTRNRLILSRRAIATLLHRIAPETAIDLNGLGAIVFRRTAPAVPTRDCWRTTVMVESGASIDGGSVVRGICTSTTSVTRYDRQTGALVARQALPAGASIGPIAPPTAPVVARGEAMTMISRAGVVTIERQVTAMQPGRAGRRLFVRDAVGHVFAANIEKDAR